MRSTSGWIITASVLVSVGSAFAQTPASNSTFEVASVKQNRSGSGRWEAKGTPTGIVATNTTPEELIVYAYALRQFEVHHEPNNVLLGEPRWISSERYDVTATAGRAVKPDEVQAMVRALLHERFKLVIHQEHKPSQTSALMIVRPDRLGPPDTTN